MRNSGSLRLLGLVMVALLGVVACAPSAPQLKKVIEENPDILYAAMRKDPVKFLEVVNEIAEAAKGKKEAEQFEEAYKDIKNPVIDESRVIEGPKTAPITIVEYSDFQCTYCQDGHNVMTQVLKEYGDKVRILMKNYPIDRIHPQARKMARLYEAMGTKDKAKAIEFKKFLFETQANYAPTDAEKNVKTEAEFMSKYNKRIDAELVKIVKKFGFDFAELKKIGDSEAITKIIDGDGAEAQSFGFTGTPGYVIDGVALRGAYDLAVYKQVIDRRLAGKK